MSYPSHAFVLPDQDFDQWYQALKSYRDVFERVTIIRSVAGNDLNGYRNVTAVNAPSTWLNDDPLFHIRRIYPQVVRVDVVPATTPEEMAQVLQARIAANDRYGELINGGTHIDDRFIFGYPVDHRPMRIVNPFTTSPTGSGDDNYGIDFAAHPNATVNSVTAGQVTALGDRSLTVTTQHLAVTYKITYLGMDNISIPINRIVAIGDKLGEAAGDKLRVYIQAEGGSNEYAVPNIIDPSNMIYIDNLRIRPTGAGLRVRTLPSTDGDVIGQINPWDMLLPKESHARVLAKIAQEGEWLRIRTPEGNNGYAAAWFLDTTRFVKIEVNPVGVNLDELHHLGKPSPEQLGGLGWVRFGYNVSNRTGSEDIQQAYERYAPLAEKYARAGYKVCFTTSHQTYGEGKNEFWPWPNMNDDKWRTLIQRFADMMNRIAKQYEGKDLVHCWQVWNEQDAPIGAVASVPMNAQNYGKMLAAVVPAIRSVDSDMLVVTGGHTSGPGKGSQYASTAINMIPAGAQPDGIAFHPYGRGTNPSSPYYVFGHIDDSIREYSKVMPDKPLWITEWGVLDRGQDDPTAIANYATNFVSHVKTRYKDKVACMIWYAWAQGMHNGYGIVDSNGNPRSPLTERFLNA